MEQRDTVRFRNDAHLSNCLFHAIVLYQEVAVNCTSDIVVAKEQRIKVLHIDIFLFPLFHFHYFLNIYFTIT